MDNTPTLTSCLPSWSLNLCQLEPGNLQTKLSQIDLPGIHFGRLQASQALEIVGQAPEGLQTIIVPARSDHPFSWSGRPLAGDQALLLPSGSPIQATVRTPCDVFVLSLSTGALPNRLLGSVNRYLHGRQTWFLDKVDLPRLRQALIDLDQAVISKSPFPRFLEDDLTSSFNQATCRSMPSLRRRDEGLIRARTLITESEGQDLTLEDLCEAAQVSHRTLVYAFRDHFGIPPKRFLVVYRLNGVRQDFFLHGHAGTKIIDVASHWGFWHMGQFASDYRRLFGELPSTTLNKISAARPGDDIAKPAANPSPHHEWTWFPTPTWSLA